MRRAGHKTKDAYQSHGGRRPLVQIQRIGQQRHRAGNVRRITCECEKAARVNRSGQQCHDIAQAAEPRIGDMVFVQIRPVGLPERRVVQAFVP